MIRLVALSLMILMACMQATGQQAPEFIFKHISTNEGLVSNNVFCTLQDKKGLWWIGTDNGLQRWDGYRFIEYHHSKTDSASISSDIIFNLLEDRQDRIWIAHPNGISIYDRKTGRIKRVDLRPEEKKPLVSDQLNSFFEDDEGTIWIAGGATGVRYYDSASNGFLLFNHKWASTDMRFNFIAQQPSTKQYWLGRVGGGLACYDRKLKVYYSNGHHPPELSFLNQPFLNYDFTALHIDKFENLWLCNWPVVPFFKPAFYKYNLQTKRYTPIEPYLGEAKTLVSDDFGNVWFGGGSLVKYNEANNKFEFISKQEHSVYGIDFDLLWALSKDNYGNLCAATTNGIFVFYPGPKAVTKHVVDTAVLKGNPVNMSVTGFLEYDKNNIWVTTWGQGAFLYDSSFRLKKQIWKTNTRYSGMAWCVTKGNNNKVYMGWQEGMMMEYDPATGLDKKFVPEALRGKTVRQIVCAKDGNIWMGTQRGLLVMYDPLAGKFTRYWDETVDGKVNGHIMSMALDVKGSVWIGTSVNGLFEFDPRQRKILRHIDTRGTSKRGLIENTIRDMCFLNDSTMIIVTVGGVEILNTKTEQSIPFEYPGIRTNNISLVAKSVNDNIYLGGPNGLTQFKLPEMKMYQFGTADGVLNYSYSNSAHYNLSNGLVCLGTSRNFITIDEQVLGKTRTASAIITGIRVMNKPLSIDSIEATQSPVELTYDRNYVAIDFACPTMLLNPTNTFLYKMEGFDKEWRISDQYPTAEYSNLPPGSYTFLLKYRNTDGKESNLTSAIPFIIHPPFWKTWWFRGLLTLLVALFLYLLHRIRINKLLTMEKVRVHIARDLHDDMGSTLSSINILSVMSNKTLEKEPFKTKEYLIRISEYSQRMMETMDDIVWSINPLNDTMQKIVARMRELAATILEPKDIEYRFYVDEHVEHIKLEMGKRREFFLIYKEALNNMAKYAECSRSIIHITTKKKRLLMHLEDNGKGFDESILDDGNGLINMRKRAESLGGRLLIHSAIGHGTEITLNIPVS